MRLGRPFSLSFVLVISNVLVQTVDSACAPGVAGPEVKDCERERELWSPRGTAAMLPPAVSGEM